MRKLTFAALSVLLLGATPDRKFAYPDAAKGEQKDTYAGSVVVADPYRWLETDVRESADVRKWIEAENKITFSYLASLPYRDAIKKRLTKLSNYAKYSVPFKQGGRYFYTKNDGLQNQSVLYTQKTLDDAPHVLLDPNTWSKDGTVALSGYVISDDGRYVAYGVADAGSDWMVWRVREIETSRDLPDEIRWVKFNAPAWTKDSKGFFYTRFPEPKPGAAFQDLNTNSKVYYHHLGAAQKDDVVVYYRPEHPDWNYSNEVTEDGRYLVTIIWAGLGARYQILYKDLAEPYGMPATLIDKFENEYELVGNDGSVLYFKTDLDAPRRRVIAIDLAQPDRANWREIVPQSSDLLEDVSDVGGYFVGQYVKDARSAAKVFSRDGKFVRDVDFGTLGVATGFDGHQNDPETFYSFASFTVPPSYYRYDVATGEKRLVFRSDVDFDPDRYEVKQVFYKSKDGTRVPMFIAHKNGVRLDGNNPTLLYGYGGFNLAQKPAFKPSTLLWLEMGGVYALANLRGGSEYGEEWHRAGTKLQKQNVFDDFIAAGEWLIANKYTRSQKLAILGGSNGGLLVGAVLNQRPDLFGAAVAANGVMDMLRFHRFTAGRYWTDDYGSSDNADEFRALYAYSPYHNVRKGRAYPATLVTTADHDDRVVPGHSFKYAAALQEAQSGSAPVLIRIETRAGHGAGKPLTKQIDEIADQWTFLAANLGMKLPKGF